MTARYSRYLPHLIFILDLFVINTSMLFAFLLSSGSFLWANGLKEYLILANISWILISSLSKNYIISRPISLTDIVNKYIVSIIYFSVVLLSILYFMRIMEIPRGFIILHFTLLLISAILNRSLVLFILDYIRKKGFNKRNILLIGEENIIKRLSQNFKAHPEYGYNTFISKENQNQLLDKINYFIKNRSINEVFICYTQINQLYLQEIISYCDNNLVKVKLASDLMLNNRHAQLINYDEIPVISVSEEVQLNLKVQIIKRSFDLLFSSSVLIFGFPIFLILIILTKITSKGPIFYSQERIGKNMKAFKIYKFRSMYIDSEKLGPQLSSNLDPRITNWGRIMRKTRLDELPQFYNVIRGEMSVVGPRPERQFFIEKILEKAPNYRRLLALKPGLTSIGQVEYGYAENIDQMCNRLDYDLNYLNKVSLLSDIKIIFKTVKVMIKAEGK
jgi:exopolysaccharide biosynthesis polyprenyl glycosylphosphotransferase